MKKALVLGAGGFIGGHLVSRLKRTGIGFVGLILKHTNIRKPMQMSFFY
jgi:nucleoside-diphosphate-sugar epimerase